MFKAITKLTRHDSHFKVSHTAEPNQLPPWARCNLLIGLNQGYPFTTRKDVVIDLGVFHEPVAGRAEFTT